MSAAQPSPWARQTSRLRRPAELSRPGCCDLSHQTFGTRSCEAEPGVVAVDGSLSCFSVYSPSGAYAFDVVAYPNLELAEHAACGITRVTGAACGNIGGNAAVCRETDPRLHRGTCEVTSCGDGYLDKTSGEACDYKPCLDGLACSVLSRTCQPQSCGNGVVTVGEQCDDGDTTGGDGCSAACVVEPIAAASIPTGTTPSAPIEGGVVYPFTGGSAARAIAISGPWEPGYTRYLRLHFDAASKIRALNVNTPWGQFRIWKLDAPSSCSTAGTLVFGIPRTFAAYPSWFAALTPGSVSDVTCDSTTGDELCTSPGTGSDCVDCGARYGSTPRSDYGFDARLAPGDYLVEINIFDVASPCWLFLGESPSEARQFR